MKKKIKGILVISGCGNSGLVNKESMQIRNKDFIFHKSIGAIRSGLLHKFFQNDRQKIKETSHLVLDSSDIQKKKKKKKIRDRCEGSLPRGLVIEKHSLQFKPHEPDHCRAKLIKLFYSFRLSKLKISLPILMTSI